VATLATAIDKRAVEEKSRNTLAYNAVLLFTFLYYVRPEDLIPGLNAIPLEKIIGGIAFIALIVTLASGRVKRKLPLELKLLLLLFAQLIISIPFAYWRGGAFATVFEKFSKGVIVAILVTLTIDNFTQLRRLFWVQAASLIIMTVASIVIHHTDQGRLIGALGGIFENPNDLAINISINWPLCLAFLLAARGSSKKAIWTIGVLCMLLGVILTYSRSGLLAMLAAVAISVWKFGIRGRRSYLVVGAMLLGLVGMGVVVVTPHYMARIESIFGGKVQEAGDHGSWEARKELLEESIKEAIHHPLFGIGAGNFGAATGTWHVTHNTYTEFAAECGFPALFLLLAILYRSFANLKKLRSFPAYLENPEIQLFTDALWASLAAFMVGALFASFEYHLFPYFMVAYSSVLYRLTAEQSAQVGQPVQQQISARDRVWKRYMGESTYANDKITKRT
jgi:putative inorganic carbon (hco3(-)) transporter